MDDGGLGRKKSLVKPDRRRSAEGGGGGPVSGNGGLQSSATIRRRMKNNLAAAELVRETRHDSLFRSMGRKKKSMEGPRRTWWVIASWALTFYIPSFLLHRIGKKDPSIQQAFREKLALCTITFFMMLVVAFMTFAMNPVLCGKSNASAVRDGWQSSSDFLRGKFDATKDLVFVINGKAYTNSTPIHQTLGGFPNSNIVRQAVRALNGSDISLMFQPTPGSSSCTIALPSYTYPLFPCNAKSYLTGNNAWPPAQGDIANVPAADQQKIANVTYPCHNTAMDISNFNTVGDLTINFTTVLASNYSSNRPLMVYNGYVLDLSVMATMNQTALNKTFGSDLMHLIAENVGADATMAFANAGKLAQGQCLTELFKVGVLDGKSPGCLAASIISNTAFVVIGCVIGARFILALYFSYFISWRLGNSKSHAKAMEDLRRRRNEQSQAKRGGPVAPSANGGEKGEGANDIQLNSVGRTRQGADPRFARNGSSKDLASMSEQSNRWSYNFGFMDMEAPPIDSETQKLLNDPTLMHTLVMVPCYSEGEESLKATLSSVAKSYYPSTHKCLFVIADGIVKGSENNQTTPDILIDMIEVDERFRHEDPRWGGEPEAYSYVAIADGTKRKNHARVYAGWYRYDATPEDDKKKRKVAPVDDRAGRAGGAHLKTLRQRTEGRVPMLLIVKCGNEEERDPENPAAKPGNRGKRDSQVILMNFLSKVMFDDRMTELEFDIFFKLFTITGVNPERYESVLMVDADTRIYPDSMTHMVACLIRDTRVMGLCGETRILNKWESFTTMIQVFEYFVSHHLAKAFESVFGGVTCLPGCFSMYRIKTPKGANGHWVPILANPDIVEEYSENIVDTLHKKNLLLLGEDRFLSTMMLRNFPKRRMVFVPPAICKTVVPNTFKILLSQRRRWINSTIHNLMELMLVKDLCGTFCISMQFIIFMELVGTVVLPAAISFTIFLLISGIVQTITDGHMNSDNETTLLFLAAILGLPAVLILLTANKVIYIFWMLIYLISLPIWNFILPLYAFWHFDDFSWGETRKVSGEVKQADHSNREGEFDSTGISMKRWREWVKVRRSEAEAADPVAYQTNSNRLSRMQLPNHPTNQYPQHPQLSRQPQGHFDTYSSNGSSGHTSSGHGTAPHPRMQRPPPHPYGGPMGPMGGFPAPPPGSGGLPGPPPQGYSFPAGMPPPPGFQQGPRPPPLMTHDTIRSMGSSASGAGSPTGSRTGTTMSGGSSLPGSGPWQPGLQRNGSYGGSLGAAGGGAGGPPGQPGPGAPQSVQRSGSFGAGSAAAMQHQRMANGGRG
ncbi:Chitin synthase, class 3 [Irineochytrium annulatum]|nr:Chitin synthase, class 3 [Irineochytrium annulatum]